MFLLIDLFSFTIKKKYIENYSTFTSGDSDILLPVDKRTQNAFGQDKIQMADKNE